MGAAADSPLAAAVDAGAAALPTLLKLTGVLAAQGTAWQALRQLPVEVPLPQRFAFHSVFACPVARDQASPDNPPMILPCGCAAPSEPGWPCVRVCSADGAPTNACCAARRLVLCRQSIQKLARGNARVFKCPYCPVRAPASAALHAPSCWLTRLRAAAPQIEVAVSQCKEIHF